MDLSRIEDYIINGEGIDLNLYGQRDFISPTEEDTNKLFNYLLYVAVKYYNFDANKYYGDRKISKYIPNDFLKNCSSFEEAELEINKLKEYLSNYLFSSQISYKVIFERSLKHITNSITSGGGEHFFSKILKKEEKETDTRIYVPCNSEYCYRFARLLIEKSVKNGLDFNFKVMHVIDRENGADNIVIYVIGEELKLYIDIINEIIYENPDITFGKLHMFGYPANQFIAVTPNTIGDSYSGYARTIIEKNINKYGRTKLCAQELYNLFNKCLYESGIIDDVENIKSSLKI